MPYSHNDSVADCPYVSAIGRMDDDRSGTVDRVAILSAELQLSESAHMPRRFPRDGWCVVERIELGGAAMSTKRDAANGPCDSMHSGRSFARVEFWTGNRNCEQETGCSRRHVPRFFPDVRCLL